MRLSIGMGVAALFAGGVAWFTGAMPGERARGEWTALDAAESDLAGVLAGHVTALSQDIGARNAGPGLAAAADHLRRRLARGGWDVVQHEDGDLECMRVGTRHEKDVILVLARYDAPSRSPGADAWASSAAAAVELAVLHAEDPCERGLAFVLGAGEGCTARALERNRQAGLTTCAVLLLGPLGRYGGEYEALPLPLLPFAGRAADHLLFVSDWRGRDALHVGIGAFRTQSLLPSEGLALPRTFGLRALGDLEVCASFGAPALLATDGGAWRDADAGTVGDTPDKLDYERMARAVLGLHSSLRTLTLRAALP